MKLLENYKNLIEKAKVLDRKTLEAIRYFLMFIIVADLFGIYWYLHLKKLGGAIMVVVIVALSIILILERKLPPLPKQELKGGKPKKMEDIFEGTQKEEQEEEQEEEVQEKEQPGLMDGFDTGLSELADGYQERMEKALGTF